MAEQITVTLSRERGRALIEAARYTVADPNFVPRREATMGAERLRAALDQPATGENSGQDWMQTSLATVLAHFESEANAADTLALQHRAGTEPRIRYRTERDTYRYVLREIKSAKLVAESGGGS